MSKRFLVLFLQERTASLLRNHFYYFLASITAINLEANAGTLHIEQLLTRESLTPIYGDPFYNSRVPDFIAVTDHGVICTGGTKLAAHGGFSDDDRNVALLLSAPGIAPQIVESLAYTNPR